MKIIIDREDNFADIVRKATLGLKRTPASVATDAQISSERLDILLAEKAQPTEDEVRAVAQVLQLNADKLIGIARDDWRPASIELGDHLGHQINAPYPSNGYFLYSRDGGEAAIVDPGGDADNIGRTLGRSKSELRYILLTHKHPDHVDALAEVRAAFPTATVYVHPLDAPSIGTPARGASDVVDGASIPFGGESISFVHTPGHTDGSACYVYRDLMFTGDTLFAGSLGRTFGEKFGYSDLLQSVKAKIFSLPRATIVLPGHGPPSTVEQEIAHDPFL